MHKHRLQINHPVPENKKRKDENEMENHNIDDRERGNEQQIW